MTQDLAHKRPWLLLSLLFGISYPLTSILNMPGMFALIWKMSAAGMLVGYALRRHHGGLFLAVAGIMALYSLGDGLVEIDLYAGGFAFAAGHIIAIWMFFKHRRAKRSLSQNMLAVITVILAPYIAYLLAGAMAAAYTLVLAIMAAMAWISSFPRYRVGSGAMLFVCSDLLLFGREAGHLNQYVAIDMAIWFLYYIGILLIAIGTVQTLAKQDIPSD